MVSFLTVYCFLVVRPLDGFAVFQSRSILKASVSSAVQRIVPSDSTVPAVTCTLTSVKFAQ